MNFKLSLRGTTKENGKVVEWVGKCSIAFEVFGRLKPFGVEAVFASLYGLKIKINMACLLLEKVD